MLSSNASNFVEKTLSQSHSQLILKSFRGIEEEIVAKVNHFRLKISHVKDKLELLIKESSNPEDCTITIKEINKTIKYESQENLDKLMSYLSYLSELKHTIPDFCYAPYLNSVFTRNFSSTVDTQKGLLQKSTDNNEKLKRLIPSRNYLGIYIPDLELKDIESILCFIILEEFLMLSSKDARLKSDNLTIEINNDEVPQHISIFNPSFNTLVAYACEKEQHLYLLFLTDVLELMGPDNAEFPYGSKIDFFDSGRKPKFSKALTRIEADKLELTGKKYDNLKTTLPDISLEQAERFIRFLDHDHDHKITVDDVTNFAKKHKLVLDDSAINGMFEEIFERRSVVVESQRRNPIDAYEVYHAVRYKYKKDHETNNWVPSAREHRDTWLMLFKLAGIELPKHTLPPIKTLPLLCNYEYTFPSLKATQKMNKTQVTYLLAILSNNNFSKSAYIIREPKPEILKKQYKPEANILIQNTQNIMELYIDDREHNKPEDSHKNAFQTLVNAKFKDLTQKTEYQTIEFSTQGYYKEALRLSKDPETYLHEKINPIFRYVPVKKDYVYHQNVQELESLKDTRSAMQTDEMELDVSVEPNNGSKRVTMYSIREFPTKSIKSAKSFKPSNVLDTHRIQGSLRPLALSSSVKERLASPHGQNSNKPIFYTSFKIPDNETLRMNVAKLEPILDGYNPPKNYNFRTDLPPEDKPQFITNWQKEIPDVIKDPYATDIRPREVVDQERYAREMHEMRLKGVKRDVGPWVNYFKLAPKERGFVDFKYPDFLEKGDYQDGFIRGATFIRPEVETDVPFKLVHRSLRKTDKNLTFGDDVPTKGF